MMASQSLRVGFVGAGGNTRARHLPNLQRIDGVELVSVANRTRATAEIVAKEFGIARVEGDWKAVVAAPDIDAIVVGTWPNMHAEVSIAALRAGKHVLTEARMARDVAEADRMMQESAAHPKLVAQIVPAPYTLDFDSTVADMLTHGRIGPIREVCVTQTGPSLADVTARQTWRQDFELSGFNTLTIGIYCEMVQRWLRADPESIVADASVHTATRPAFGGEGGAEIRIPDSVTFLGRYPAGAPGFARGARIIGHFSGVEKGVPRNEIRLNGEKGCLRFDLGRQELFLTSDVEESLVQVAASERRGWRVEEDFVDSIRNGTPVKLTDFATGVRYMRVTEAIWKSWNADGSRKRV